MGDERVGEGVGPVLQTQASALAGISHGVETQVLKNVFDSLPPSSEIVESEMLGMSVSKFQARCGLNSFHRPRNSEAEPASRRVN